MNHKQKKASAIQIYPRRAISFHSRSYPPLIFLFLLFFSHFFPSPLPHPRSITRSPALSLQLEYTSNYSNIWNIIICKRTHCISDNPNQTHFKSSRGGRPRDVTDIEKVEGREVKGKTKGCDWQREGSRGRGEGEDQEIWLTTRRSHFKSEVT